MSMSSRELAFVPGGCYADGTFPTLETNSDILRILFSTLTNMPYSVGFLVE